jgi:SRSO17 transposase
MNPDESGNSKKGSYTACVQRQWCGNTGKIDNCVVGVHTAYVAGDFQCILDSDLYLPEDWADDPARRKADFVLSEAQSASPKVSQKKDSSEIAKTGYENQPIELLCTS